MGPNGPHGPKWIHIGPKWAHSGAQWSILGPFWDPMWPQYGPMRGSRWVPMWVHMAIWAPLWIPICIICLMPNTIMFAGGMLALLALHHVRGASFALYVLSLYIVPTWMVFGISRKICCCVIYFPKKSQHTQRTCVLITVFMANPMTDLIMGARYGTVTRLTIMGPIWAHMGPNGRKWA
jgi:hypothetical protein